jgi:Fe2+ transport system protein FeoA
MLISKPMTDVNSLTIIKVPQGQKVKLLNFDGPAFLVERLIDMGFYVNVELENLGRLPFAGPILVRCEQTLLALREEEAMCLKIQI